MGHAALSARPGFPSWREEAGCLPPVGSGDCRNSARAEIRVLAESGRRRIATVQSY